MDFLAIVNEYVRSELIVVTPVLYIFARMMENSRIRQEVIPWYLLLIAFVLAGLYTFSMTDISSVSKVLMALFSTIVQSVLLSGTAVFGGILGTLTTKLRDDHRTRKG